MYHIKNEVFSDTKWHQFKVRDSFSNRDIQGLFFLIFLFLIQSTVIKFWDAYDWILTAALWCWKQLSLTIPHFYLFLKAHYFGWKQLLWFREQEVNYFDLFQISGSHVSDQGLLYLCGAVKSESSKRFLIVFTHKIKLSFPTIEHGCRHKFAPQIHCCILWTQNLSLTSIFFLSCCPSFFLTEKSFITFNK